MILLKKGLPYGLEFPVQDPVAPPFQAHDKQHTWQDCVAKQNCSPQDQEAKEIEEEAGVPLSSLRACPQWHKDFPLGVSETLHPLTNLLQPLFPGNPILLSASKKAYFSFHYTWDHAVVLFLGLTLLSKMSSSLIHVVINSRTSFLKAKYSNVPWSIYTFSFSIHLLNHLGCFHILTTVNNTAMNKEASLHNWFQLLWRHTCTHTHRNRMAWAILMLVFHNDCINLHSHQEYTKYSLSSTSLPTLLFHHFVVLI